MTEEKFLEAKDAEDLVLKLKYDKIYTEVVKSNGGNSAKISCPKSFIGHEVVVFVLKKKQEKPKKNEK